MEKDTPCKWKLKVAILITDKINFKIKTYKIRGRTPHNDQRINLREDITIVNIYAPNLGAPQYTRQMLMVINGEIKSNTIIVGDFNTHLTPIDRSSRQKINKET